MWCGWRHFTTCCAAGSAAKLLRIGFEHKQSTADKATYQMKISDVKHVSSLGRFVTMLPSFSHELVICIIMHLDFHVQAEVTTPTEYTFKEGRGQVSCCLLAADSMCQLPLDLELTDGKQNHLLRLRGDWLLVYEGYTPKQVRQTFVSPLMSFLKHIKTGRS